MNLNEYLDLFENELDTLNSENENIVLCGSNILRLHGLELGWEPHDLDVAVYKPSIKQLDFIESQHPCSDYHEDETRA